MAYPLLFPRREPGWQPNLRYGGKRTTLKYTRLSPIQFCAYRLMICDYDPEWNNHDEDEEAKPGDDQWRLHLEPGLSHSGGQVFPQMVYDYNNRAEAHRLLYVRPHQQELRAETYQGILDAVRDPSYQAGELKIGKKIILPSSFPDSPRAMAQNYYDAMSIVRKYGKPGFFIRRTANPAWKEIQPCHGEKVTNRPDLMACVFHLQLNDLQKLLMEYALGVVVAYICVIGIQKRGLPHARILLIAQGADKLRTAEDVED